MTGPLVTCALAAALAAWALLPGPRPARLARAASPRRTAAAGPSFTWALAGVAAGTAGLAVMPSRGWILAATAGVVVATAVWTVRRGAAERTRLRHRAEVVRSCGVIAGQLDIGEIPVRALQVGAQDCPLIAPAAAALAIGGDATAELRAIGARPGCGGLVDLADGWTLCERTGMPLAAVVRRIADAVRAQADDEAAREAELSPARATGRLMAVLPGVGMMLGAFVGADPLGFLFGGWVGQLCLLGAAGLACAGLVWTQRLSEERA